MAEPLLWEVGAPAFPIEISAKALGHDLSRSVHHSSASVLK